MFEHIINDAASKACSRCMLNTTVEYAQVCYSVLATILITNYMMLGSGSMLYTTETICCWSALVQYDFGEFTTCVIHCTSLFLAAVYPQELSSLLPQTYDCILQGLRLHCHAFMILYAWYIYCCYASSDFDDTWMWIASVLASLHILTAFPLPVSAHNLGGVPNRSCDKLAMAAQR